MKKLAFLILFLLVNVVYAELNQQDLGKIEIIVGSEVKRENEKLREDLNKDLEEVKTEVYNVLSKVEGYQAKDKIVLVLTLSATIIISLTLFSFLQFLIYRKKRKLKPIDNEVLKKKWKKAGKVKKS